MISYHKVKARIDEVTNSYREVMRVKNFVDKISKRSSFGDVDFTDLLQLYLAQRHLENTKEVIPKSLRNIFPLRINKLEESCDSVGNYIAALLTPS